jgi:hypothetical protein
MLFAIDDIAPLVGMSTTFISKVCGHRGAIGLDQLLVVLDQDSFAETFIPRSKILEFLLRMKANKADYKLDILSYKLDQTDAIQSLLHLPDASVQCVVTSTLNRAGFVGGSEP